MIPSWAVFCDVISWHFKSFVQIYNPNLITIFIIQSIEINYVIQELSNSNNISSSFNLTLEFKFICKLNIIKGSHSMNCFLIQNHFPEFPARSKLKFNCIRYHATHSICCHLKFYSKRAHKSQLHLHCSLLRKLHPQPHSIRRRKCKFTSAFKNCSVVAFFDFYQPRCCFRYLHIVSCFGGLGWQGCSAKHASTRRARAKHKQLRETHVEEGTQNIHMRTGVGRYWKGGDEKGSA